MSEPAYDFAVIEGQLVRRPYNLDGSPYIGEVLSAQDGVATVEYEDGSIRTHPLDDLVRVESNA